MGKLADQITTDCCGSLLNDKAQLVKDVAALEALNSQLSGRVAKLKQEVIVSNADLDLFKAKFSAANLGYSTFVRSNCRTVFNTMYKGEPKYKEQVWANLCLTLGIDA
jgi:cell division protein FtsB